MYLFLDTTVEITIGLLDSNLNWIKYYKNSSRKISSQIHKFIDDIMSENNLEIKELSGLIYTAGPGSYTGMRVSDGIAQIFDWHKIPIFSFYHFEVPKLCEIEAGKWVAKAFKGEMFVYEWDSKASSSKLIPTGEVSFSDSDKIFGLEEDVVDKKVETTSKLIEESSTQIFKKIIDSKQRNDLFYYRDLEDEFSRC